MCVCMKDGVGSEVRPSQRLNAQGKHFESSSSGFLAQSGHSVNGRGLMEMTNVEASWGMFGNLNYGYQKERCEEEQIHIDWNSTPLK